MKLMKLETIDGELVSASFVTAQGITIYVEQVADEPSVILGLHGPSLEDKAAKLDRSELRALVHALSCAIVPYGMPETR